MATLLEKVSTLISANLHALLDKALQSNSLAVIDEYIRQVENNLADLEDAAATVGGQVKTLKRKMEEFEAKAAELDRNIDIFLRQGKEDLAIAAQSKLNSTQRLAQQYREQYERQQSEYQKLLDAKLKLEAKLTTIKQERQEMQALLDLARSKEITVKAIKSLDDLVGAGDSDVARMAESIRARLDKASARAEMHATRLEEQMDQVLETEQLKIQLEERKKRLGLSSESEQ
ncbi:MAG: PspA/IM30 family protein [Anaerolineae bacterium]|jgi:phage shock protein A|nr:PspA/IM30 family protein [Anaerolineae bacterium]MDH7472388.1 PspA/IM30 family protein [Anaerolineae bacterium]